MKWNNFEIEDRTLEALAVISLAICALICGTVAFIYGPVGLLLN